MDLLIAGLPVSGVIVALVEGAKRAGLPTRWAPVFAVALGLACGLLAQAGLIQSRQMRREHYASAYIVHASVIPLLTHRRKIGKETDDLQGSFERTPDFPDNE